LQANVMALYGKRGGDGLVLRQSQPGTHRPVVKSSIPAPQPGLEAVAILAKVVLVSGKPSLLAPRGGASEGPGLIADGPQMLTQVVPFTSRVGAMGIKIRVFHPTPPKDSGTDFLAMDPFPSTEGQRKGCFSSA
jgi:hypothetical protein